MEAARHRSNRVLSNREDGIELEKSEWRSLIRDRKHKRPCVPLYDIPAARRLRQIAQRSARFLLGATLDRIPERPGEQADRTGRKRPNPDTSALPQPEDAEHEQRQPRQGDEYDQQRFAPV